MKRFLEWLALTNSKGYPTALEDFSVYLQARQSEPCTRGALNRAYGALVLLEEAAGVTNEAKVTTTSVHLSIEKGVSRHLPPHKTSSAKVDLHTHGTRAVDGRWQSPSLLQNLRVVVHPSWGTMRFSDHRGLKSADVTVTRNSMVAHLTR